MTRYTFVVGSMDVAEGVSRVVCNQANYFAKMGEDVSVVAPKFRPSSILRFEKNVKRWRVPVVRWIKPLDVLLPLRSCVKGLRSDIVVANDATSALSAGSAKTVAFYTHRGHVDDERKSRVSRFGQNLALARQYHLLAYRRSDLVIANSRWCANEFAARGIRAEVVYPGVNVGDFSPTDKAEAKDEIRRLYPELAISAETELLVNVGWFRGNKAHEIILEAVRELGLRRPKLRLIFIGRGWRLPYVQALTTSIGLDGKVNFLTKQIPDFALRLWYCAANLYVHANEFEHFGLPIAEAQSCGTPAVVPDRGGGAEIVSDDETGFLFQSGDSKSLAQRLDAALSSGRLENMGRAARVRMEKVFDTNATDSKLYSLLSREVQSNLS